MIAMSNKNNLIEDYNGDLIPSTDRYFIDTITKEITAKFYDMGVDKATTSTSSTFGSKAETYSFDNDNSLQERCYNLLAKTRYYSSEVFETSFVIEGIDQEGQVDPDSAKFATGEYLDQVSIEKSDTETDTTLLTKQAILDAVKKESSQLFFNDGSSVNTQETKAETLIERFAEVLTDGTLHLSARTNDGTQFTVAIDPNTGHFDLDGLIIKSGSLANIDIVDDNDNKIGSFEFIGQDGGK